MHINDHRTWKHIGIGDVVVVQHDWQSRRMGGDRGIEINLPRGTLLQVTSISLWGRPTFQFANGVTVTVPETAMLRIKRATPLEALAFV